MNAKSYNGSKQNLIIQKKWLISCGGCLILLVIVTLALFLSGNIELNASQGIGSKSTETIFGSSYEPKDYAVFGVPLMDLKNVKDVVTLINSKKNLIILAVALKEPTANLSTIKSKNSSMIKAYLNSILSQTTRQGHLQTKFSELKVKTIESMKLTNGKTILFANAINHNKENKKSASTPAVLALIPEKNNELVILIVTNGKSPLSKTKGHLSHDYQSLQKMTKQIITDSELDDRLVLK